ncbi:MAG: hypothetical protein K2R93_15935 [Gemmatimonadaceae bacterium]|nr:hypothetical protein [Gemmatimonadaceae bacterium]
MTERQYFFRALLFPLVLPLAAWGLVLLMQQSGHAYRTPTDAIYKSASLLAFTGAFSTIPYLLYLGPAIWWARTRPSANLRRVAWWAPALIAVGVCTLNAGDLLWRGQTTSVAIESAIYGGAALVVGYAYVLLVFASLTLLRAAGLVHTTDHRTTPVPSTSV